MMVVVVVMVVVMRCYVKMYCARTKITRSASQHVVNGQQESTHAGSCMLHVKHTRRQHCAERAVTEQCNACVHAAAMALPKVPRPRPSNHERLRP